MLIAGWIVMGVVTCLLVAIIFAEDGFNDTSKYVPVGIGLCLSMIISQACLYSIGSQSCRQIFNNQIVYKIESVSSDSVKVYIRDIPMNESKGYYYITKSTDLKIGDTLSFMGK